jgi:hypothetical protein
MLDRKRLFLSNVKGSAARDGVNSIDIALSASINARQSHHSRPWDRAGRCASARAPALNEGCVRGSVGDARPSIAEVGGPDLPQMEPAGRLVEGGRGLCRGSVSATGLPITRFESIICGRARFVGTGRSPGQVANSQYSERMILTESLDIADAMNREMWETIYRARRPADVLAWLATSCRGPRLEASCRVEVPLCHLDLRSRTRPLWRPCRCRYRLDPARPSAGPGFRNFRCPTRERRCWQ